ncbi:MAG: NTP transferase domain-containing protein [Planctomycetota bacterium]
MAKPLAAVILAAGQGKRMKAGVPKVLVPCCGRTMVDHVIGAVAPLEPARIVVVHGHGGDQVKKSLAGRDVRFAHQREQKGTGHAVQCAIPQLEGFAGDVLVLCGDTPLLRTELLADLVADHQDAGRALTLLSADMADPGSLGRILRDADGAFVGIREVSDATPYELHISEINTGVVLIAKGHVGHSLGRLKSDNAQGEFYLTDVPALLRGDGIEVAAFRTTDETAALGVNNPVDLAEAVYRMRARIRAAHLTAGVKMPDPDSCVIDAGVEIGAGTVVNPFTWIEAGAKIGERCTIGPFARIERGEVVPSESVVSSGDLDKLTSNGR